MPKTSQAREMRKPKVPARAKAGPQRPSPFVVTGKQRLIFLKPEAALRAANIKPGQTVADLGCGAGYLTIPAAIQVGPSGMVYAIDILKDNLESIRSQAKLFNLPNIQTVWADLEVPRATKLPDKLADVTLLFKVLCQQKNHETIFAEAVRITKVGGTILVAEWCEPQLTLGPARENLVTRQALLELGKKAQLDLKREHKLDDFHYVLEYRRNGTVH
ncbi:MAG: methyltransferase domain-containing protein [Parcubacteria group bacterium]